MKVVIIEDEKLARLELKNILLELIPEINIAAELDSVSSSAKYLANNSCDLIFLDIHLADDLSFKIFEQVDIKIPIIFTTAYDKYAIQAFSVNSIGYLLKPIQKDALANALKKYKSHSLVNISMLQSFKESFDLKSKSYQSRFLVKKGEKISTIKLDNIAYFEGEDRYVSLITKRNNRFFVDYKLSELEKILDPHFFFRLNRSFICHIDAIESIITLSKSRVKVDIVPKTKRDIFVSFENTRLLKLWLNR